MVLAQKFFFKLTKTLMIPSTPPPPPSHHPIKKESQRRDYHSISYFKMTAYINFLLIKINSPHNHPPLLPLYPPHTYGKWIKCEILLEKDKKTRKDEWEEELDLIFH